MVSISIIAGIIVMFCWGVAGFMMTIPVKKIGTLKTQFLSNILAFIPLIIAVILFYNSINITLLNLILLVLAGFSIVFAIYYYYKGIEMGGDVSVLSPIQGAYSWITVILSFIFLREEIIFTKVLAILLIVIGIVLTSTDIRKLKNLRSEKGVNLALIAMVLLGLQFFLMGLVTKDVTLFGLHSVATDPINLFIFTSFINPSIFILLAIFKKEIPSVKEIKLKQVYPIIIISSIMFTFAWIVLNYGLSFGEVTSLIPISSLNPALTVILAVIFYKEKLVSNQKLGVLVVLGGLFLISM